MEVNKKNSTSFFAFGDYNALKFVKTSHLPGQASDVSSEECGGLPATQTLTPDVTARKRRPQQCHWSFGALPAEMVRALWDYAGGKLGKEEMGSHCKTSNTVCRSQNYSQTQ